MFLTRDELKQLTNPLVRELRLHRQRPCLKVMNKADLADPEVTRAWIDHYNRLGVLGRRGSTFDPIRHNPKRRLASGQGR